MPYDSERPRARETEASLHMHWIYCNSCARPLIKTPKIDYYYLDCGHIYCQKCCNNEDKYCKICDLKEVSTMLFNANMELNMFSSMNCTLMFETPEQVIKKWYNVLSMQESQQMHMLELHNKNFAKLEKRKEALRAECHKEEERRSQLLERKFKLTEYVAKLERELKAGKQHDEKIKEEDKCGYKRKVKSTVSNISLNLKVTKERVECLATKYVQTRNDCIKQPYQYTLDTYLEDHKERLKKIEVEEKKSPLTMPYASGYSVVSPAVVRIRTTKQTYTKEPSYMPRPKGR